MPAFKETHRSASPVHSPCILSGCCRKCYSPMSESVDIPAGKSKMHPLAQSRTISRGQCISPSASGDFFTLPRFISHKSVCSALAFRISARRAYLSRDCVLFSRPLCIHRWRAAGARIAFISFPRPRAQRRVGNAHGRNPY